VVSPLPATKFQELYGPVVRSFLRRPDEVSLRRIEAEVEKLKSADPIGMLELKAHIAEARGAHAKAVQLYEQALKGSGNRLDVLRRYMSMLSAAGHDMELKELYERTRGCFVGNPSALRAAMNVLAASGWWQLSQAIEPELRKMALPTDSDDEKFCNLSSENVPEESVVPVVSFVKTYLRSMNAALEGVESMTVPREDGTSALFYQFLVNESSERAAELEWSLFEALDEQRFAVESARELVVAIAGLEVPAHAHLS